MNSLTIKARLAAVIGFLSLLLFAIGAFAIYGMAKLNRSLETVYEDRVLPLKQLSDINSLMMEDLRQLQLAGMHDPRVPEHTLHDHPLAAHHDRVAANVAEVTKLWTAYIATYLTPEEKKLADEFLARRTEFVQKGLLPALELQKAGQFAEANMHLVRTTGPLYSEAYRLNQALLKLQQQVAEAEHHDAVATFERFRLIAALATLLGVALAALVGWLLARAIAEPMRAAVLAANAVAGGDLGIAIDVRRNDEVGQMMQALARMVERLREVMARVQTASATVSTESGELHREVANLSQRTEQQAANLEETAATMEELTSTVRQNAENARQANDMAAAASAVAARGGRAVAEVVGTMGEISASSKRIADIIGVIDGIAFQTNILALNAAVEAARAGEQGRGFAVVATEVRSLAQRSGAAAKEIRDLIAESVRSVDSGSRRVADAGTTIDEVVRSVERLAAIMNEITAASREQSSGIDQISTAVAQLDQITQQNAGLVHAAAGTTEALEGQARSLADALGSFRLQSSGVATSAVPGVSTAVAQGGPDAPAERSATGTGERRLPRQRVHARAEDADLVAY